MKVYAHYECLDNIEYRWRTLLQFGSSWSVLGSVVMKNPGSSKKLENEIDDATLMYLNHFSNEYKWYAFSVDNTMSCIEKLFTTYYSQITGCPLHLNGVIQVFNLMNVRDPNVESAYVKQKQATFPFSITTETDIKQLIAPVYIGWGALGLDKGFRDNAERIYKIVKEKLNGNYLQNDFVSNYFYHPMYLMGQGCNQPRSQYLINSFCQNTVSPACDSVVIPKVVFSKQNIYDEVEVFLKASYQTIESKPKTCRFKLNDEITLTITTQGNGYVGIRHVDYKNKYTITEYPNTFKYKNVIDQFGYNSSDVWIGVKLFKDYGYDDKSIIKELIEEIKNLTNLVNS